MKSYCYNCDNDVDFRVEESIIQRDIKDVNFSYLAKVAFCNECGEEIYIAELSDENTRIANKEYRAIMDLIQVAEIEAILTKYNIGQKPLATLLGWGEATIIRYLKGLTPTRKYSQTLRKLMDPNYMLELFQTNKESLTPVCQRKLYSKLIALLDQGAAAVNENKLFAIAEYFLNKLDPEAGESITPLKLQKLVFYAQAWSFGFHRSSLLEEDFQAWVHGPVIPSLYIHFKEFGSANIPKVYSFDPSVFNTEELYILDIVWSVYGKYDAKYLERLTHIEDPWIGARNGLDKTAICTNVIPKEEIEKYYSTVQKKHEIYNEYGLNLYVSNISLNVC